jgi:hypothetical protein
MSKGVRIVIDVEDRLMVSVGQSGIEPLIAAIDNLQHIVFADEPETEFLLVSEVIAWHLSEMKASPSEVSAAAIAFFRRAERLHQDREGVSCA